MKGNADSGILGFSTWKEQGTRNPNNDWIPESEFHCQSIHNKNPVVFGIRNPQRRIQNLRLSWIPLHGFRYMDSLTWGLHSRHVLLILLLPQMEKK